MTWSKLQDIIERNHSFLISSHVNPDGDSICSQLAFYWYLTSLGKEVVIYSHDPVPRKFLFLRNTDKIVNSDPLRTFDVFVILDASNSSRLGWNTKRDVAPVTINIDHHKDNTLEGDLNIVDCEASATSEILYNFFNSHSVELPEHVAESLYTGILTDTGGFQFSNTNSDVLRICAHLTDNGADCSKIYRQVYTSFSPAGLLLRAKIWSTLTFYSNNRISSMEMPASLLEESGAGNGDIEGMSDQALTAAGVEVGMFIKHNNKSSHFSLRSTGGVDVGKIAQIIPGGGGHMCAAGCTIDLPLEQAKQKMLALIQKELE
jgi:phosphoesterase RecJ-like protein